MRRALAIGGVTILAAAGAVAYAGGAVNVPGICDPADTRAELPGQWGAQVVGGDCLDGRAVSGVVARDNDYAFERHDCVVYSTRSAEPVRIAFRRDNELLITTAAPARDDVVYVPACGPVRVYVQRT